MGVFLQLKPTVGYQIDQGNIFDLNHKWARTLPSLIYFDGIFIETLNKFFFSNIKEPTVGYPMKNISRTAKFLPTWGFNQRYCPDL
jgi:hypothetical protein